MIRHDTACYTSATMPFPDQDPFAAAGDNEPVTIGRSPYRYRHLGGVEGLRTLCEQLSSVDQKGFHENVAAAFAGTILAPAFDGMTAESDSGRLDARDVYAGLAKRLRRIYAWRTQYAHPPRFTLGQSVPLLHRLTGYDFQAKDHVQDFYLPLPPDTAILECYRDEWLYEVDESGQRLNQDTSHPDAKLHFYQFELLQSAASRRRVLGFMTLQLFDGRDNIMGLIPEPYPLQHFDAPADMRLLDAETPSGVIHRCVVALPYHES